jgi:DNA-binding MarR family transcriptional regulator
VSSKTDTALALQRSTQAFVRSFGLLVTKQTPCGQPVTPSVAHALMLLLERQSAEVTTYQHELAELLGLDRSSVQRLCSRLETEGRVTQEPAPEDARARRVQLTASGRRAIFELRACTASPESWARFRPRRGSRCSTPSTS